MQNKKVYVGFFLRLLSYLIDSLVFVSIYQLHFMLRNDSRIIDIFVHIPIALFWIWLNVYLVKIWGGTLGMIVLGLKVENLDGTPINLETAFLRYLIDLVFFMLKITAMIIVLWNMSDVQYKLQGILFSRITVEIKAPAWNDVVNKAAMIWSVCDLIIVLFNSKKRSIQDFLVGTIVVRE